MHAKAPLNRLVTWMVLPVPLPLLGALLASLLAPSAGCNRGNRPSPTESAGAPTAPANRLNAAPSADPVLPAAVRAQSAGGSGRAGAARAKVSDPNFELMLKPEAAYRVGQQAQIQIVLEAKGVYKVNKDYPYKFKLQPSEGIQYADLVVGKKAVALETKRAIMTVRLTPAAKGKKRVSGRFFFSICTDEKCLIEKRDLSSHIEVR